jgi:hypothetical protein
VSARDLGRAYDYWVRVVCITANCLGTDRFREFLGYRVYYEENYEAQGDFKGVMDECLRALETCYVSKNVLDRELLRHLFILGYFERDYRTGLPVSRWDLKVNKDSIDELARLAEASDTSWLVGDVVLNPVFDLKGLKGVLCADGDLIVDGVLYDLKSGRELRPLETLRQLLGYAVMNSFLARSYPIDAVGYYYVRFGRLKQIELTELCTPAQFAAIQSYIGGKLGKSRPRTKHVKRGVRE